MDSFFGFKGKLAVFTKRSIYGHGGKGTASGSSATLDHRESRALAGTAYVFRYNDDLGKKLGSFPKWAQDRLLHKGGTYLGKWMEVPGERSQWVYVFKPKKQSIYQVENSSYGILREAFSALVGLVEQEGLVEEVELHLQELSLSEKKACFTGIEMGSYRFRPVFDPQSGKHSSLRVKWVHDEEDQVVHEVHREAASVNLARHLVNLPANILTPRTFAEFLTKLLSPKMSVELWDSKRILEERLNLLHAVGKGAAEGPYLVVAKYRPQENKDSRPLAMVGKSIMYDTGGLDLKVGGTMRLMKKDMGGGAAQAAIAFHVMESNYPYPVDFYWPIAENSVSENSFRAGDILKTRMGPTIEIDNTDAEGRLVMADALTLASGEVSPQLQPALVMNFATLTGSARVALGPRITHFCSSHPAIANAFTESCQKVDEPIWWMPLVADYMPLLKSSVADAANSGTSKLAGALTAALFLTHFVGPTPWLHFDLFAWNDGVYGGCAESGGNGQMVQGTLQFLKDWLTLRSQYV